MNCQKYQRVIEELEAKKKMSEIEKDSPSREIKSEWGNAMAKTLEDGNKVIYLRENIFPQAREKLIDLLHATHSSPEMQLWNKTKLWFWPEL